MSWFGKSNPDKADLRRWLNAAGKEMRAEQTEQVLQLAHALADLLGRFQVPCLIGSQMSQPGHMLLYLTRREVVFSNVPHLGLYYQAGNDHQSNVQATVDMFQGLNKLTGGALSKLFIVTSDPEGQAGVLIYIGDPSHLPQFLALVKGS